MQGLSLPRKAERDCAGLAMPRRRSASAEDETSEYARELMLHTHQPRRARCSYEVNSTGMARHRELHQLCDYTATMHASKKAGEW